ncbi:MAG: putative bifunctional diguanylate cyclase/phosphodiesterase [Aeromonadaceae bacterium]
MELSPLGSPESVPELSLKAAAELASLALSSTALSLQLNAIQQVLQRHLPLYHFAALIEDRGNLSWQTAVDPPQPALFHQHETISDEQLAALEPQMGWSKCRVEHGTLRWLVAQTTPEYALQLQLLLEQLALRYSLQQATLRIENFASPLRQHISRWQEKLESFNRLLRLVDTLPSRQLFSQLDATLHYWMGTHDLLLLKEDEGEMTLLYPTSACYSTPFLQQLFAIESECEFEQHQLHWYCFPIQVHKQHQTTMAVSSVARLSQEDFHLLHTGAIQLGLLIELEEHRLQNGSSERWSFSRHRLLQRVRDLSKRNQRLHRELRQREEFERQLQIDSQKDPLTQLPNRAMFIHRLEQAFRHYKRYPEHGFSIMLLDLVSLRHINEQYSDQLGDLLLKNMAQLLLRNIRQNDMLARLSGDEFIFFLDASHHPDTITPVISRVLKSLEEPLLLGMETIQIHANLGVVSISPEISDISQLLRQVDIATFQAKQLGHDMALFYSEPTQAIERLSPVEALHQALQEKRILPYFHPIRRLDNQQIVQVELLARWLDEEGTLREAYDFMPLAEQSGLVLEIDTLMLRHACGLLNGLFKPLLHNHNFRLSINLSGKHLASREQVHALLQIIQDAEVSPHHLLFEFKERNLVRRDSLALNLLHEIRARGIAIAVDDFGTGCSSLNALFHFPVDYIKIDHSFTHRMINSPRDKAQIRAIRDISHDLGMAVIIEGLELDEQLVALQEMGCDLAQGLLFDTPMSADSICELFEVRPSQI